MAGTPSIPRLVLPAATTPPRRRAVTITKAVRATRAVATGRAGVRTVYPAWLSVPLRHRYVAAASILTVVATGVVTTPYLPLWKATDQNFNTPNAQTKKEDPESRRVSTAREVIAAIPEGSTVVTDLSMLAYLVPRAEVSWAGTSGPTRSTSS